MNDPIISTRTRRYRAAVCARPSVRKAVAAEV
eukprot:COSAG01_NODE_16734_length_1210_cov_1.198920_1_plen_31_part_10